jgi:peptidyl-prolyl cis-trans isomerase-like 4
MSKVSLTSSSLVLSLNLFQVHILTQCLSSFLKLCKIKYYNYAPIHTVQPNFTFQTGDPLGPTSKDSDGGSSIWGLLDSASSNRTFEPEFSNKLRHLERGTVSMACTPSSRDPDIKLAGSQFIITLGDDLAAQLDNKAAIFGKVVEGFDALEKINTAFLDGTGRPLKDIRIRHTIILEDPTPDIPGLIEPSTSPVPSKAQLATVRIADDEEIDVEADPAAMEKLRREREARQQALTLEMVGDLPFADVAPPENVLFVCKLNPVTDDEALNLIFGRFGLILSCEVIRDKRTGDSLQYAFIEYKEKGDAERAYFKMQNVLIDDHRIHVDFSQSVSRLADVWRDSANKKRRHNGGGFGGIEGLEKKRQFRAQGEDERTRAREREFEYMLSKGQASNRDVDDAGRGGREEKGRGGRDERGGRRDERDNRRRRSYSRSRSPPRKHRDRDRYRDREIGQRDREKDGYGRDERRRR